MTLDEIRNAVGSAIEVLPLKPNLDPTQKAHHRERLARLAHMSRERRGPDTAIQTDPANSATPATTATPSFSLASSADRSATQAATGSSASATGGGDRVNRPDEKSPLGAVDYLKDVINEPSTDPDARPALRRALIELINNNVIVDALNARFWAERKVHGLYDQGFSSAVLRRAIALPSARSALDRIAAGHEAHQREVKAVRDRDQRAAARKSGPRRRASREAQNLAFEVLQTFEKLSGSRATISQLHRDLRNRDAQNYPRGGKFHAFVAALLKAAAMDDDPLSAANSAIERRKGKRQQPLQKS